MTRKEACEKLAALIPTQFATNQVGTARYNAARLLVLLGGSAQINGDNFTMADLQDLAITDTYVQPVDLDRAAWERGDTVEYAGFKVVPKRDFGDKGFYDNKGGWITHGWVVVKDGCAPLPGGTWARTKEDALHSIDVWLAADQNGQKFWHLLRAIKGPSRDEGTRGLRPPLLFRT